MTLTIILAVLFSVVLFGIGFLAGSTSANAELKVERGTIIRLQSENNDLRDRLMTAADEKLKEAHCEKA